MFYRSLFALLISITGAWAGHGESYIVTCSEVKHPAHLIALSFIEFENEVRVKDLTAGFNTRVTEIAPITFKNLNAQFSTARFVVGAFKAPSADEVGALVRIPAGCSVQVAAAYRANSEISLNGTVWYLLSPQMQKYLIFEALVASYLRKDLAPVDDRRFAAYTATGVFNKYSTEEKIFFLKHYGIGELAFSSISLDLNREYKLSEKTGNFRTAYPLAGATFEKAQLDTLKIVSFYESGEVEALATLTPFKRIINGQEFSFVTFNTFKLPDPRDRTFFYPNGTIACSDAVPFKNLYNVITNIKGGWFPPSDDVIRVCFHKNQTMKYFNTGRRGTMNFMNKLVNVFAVEWYENGQYESVSFEATLFIIDGKNKELRSVRFDRNGKITSAY